MKINLQKTILMSADKFWSEWLKITMLIVIATGVLLIITGSFVPIKFLDQLIDDVFSGGVQPPEHINMLKNWLFSVNGAVMTGWGCSMLYIVNNSFRQRERWAWRCIFYPVLIWFLLDTSVSLYYGVTFNVILNCILLLQIMAPLLYLRNQFFNKLAAAT
jgi:hypothetical protein